LNFLYTKLNPHAGNVRFLVGKRAIIAVEACIQSVQLLAGKRVIVGGFKFEDNGISAGGIISTSALPYSAHGYLISPFNEVFETRTS